METDKTTGDKLFPVKALTVMHQIFNLGNTDRYRVAGQSS